MPLIWGFLESDQKDRSRLPNDNFVAVKFDDDAVYDPDTHGGNANSSTGPGVQALGPRSRLLAYAKRVTRDAPHTRYYEVDHSSITERSADRSRRPSARKREEAPRRNRTSVFEVSICGLMEPTGERPVVNTLSEPVALLPGELSVPKYRVTSSGAPGVCHWPLRGFFLDSSQFGRIFAVIVPCGHPFGWKPRSIHLGRGFSSLPVGQKGHRPKPTPPI